MTDKRKAERRGPMTATSGKPVGRILVCPRYSTPPDFWALLDGPVAAEVWCAEELEERARALWPDARVDRNPKPPREYGK